ncbi:MAG: hypothetical protein IJ157_14375 [Clostridia bacterium]|nr:hypothetical protein [Clostridia bacterium]
MNNFANSLLHLLLSWMRALFGSLLSFAQDGSGGIFAWLTGHWLPVAAVLLVLGITLDVIIYILRWRPQYVWRTKLNRLFHRGNYAYDDPQFNEGYDTALSNFNFADTPIPDLTNEPAPAEVMESYFAEPVAYQEGIEETASQPSDEQPAGQRRRRSDRHEKHALGRFELSRRRNSEPAIDARSAFHAPVYPETEPYQQEQNGDNY